MRWEWRRPPGVTRPCSLPCARGGLGWG